MVVEKKRTQIKTRHKKKKSLKEMSLDEIYEATDIPWDEIPIDIALNVKRRFGLKLNDNTSFRINTELKSWKNGEVAQHAMTLVGDIYAEIHSQNMRNSKRKSDYEAVVDRFLKADKEYREAFAQLTMVNSKEHHFRMEPVVVKTLNEALNHFQWHVARFAFNQSLYSLDAVQEPSKENKKIGKYKPKEKVGPRSEARVHFAISALITILNNGLSISQEKAIEMIQPLLKLIGYNVNNSTIREKILAKAPKEMFISKPSVKAVCNRFKGLALNSSVNNSKN